MRNIIIFVALLGAAAIFTVLYCLIAAGSQAEKKLTEITNKKPCGINTMSWGVFGKEYYDRTK